MSLAGPHGFRRTAVDTTAKFRLMECVLTAPDSNGENYGFFQYAQADGAVDVGAICRISHAGQADEITTTESGSVGNILGVAQSTLADNEYGWFWRGMGKTEAIISNGTTAGQVLTTTATAGEAGTGGDAIATAFAVDANSSGSAALGTIAAYGLIGTN